MDYNLHTHTKRCGHASGEDEEYVLAAIKRGIETLGFSDHAPFGFPDRGEQGHCIQTRDAKSYCESILALKKKYEGKIDIHLGFEMEYYPAYFDGMLSYVKSLGAEYLILGQHAIYNGEYFVHGISNSEEKFKEYIRCAIEAMEKGCFSYLAHPDIMQLSGNDKLYEEEVRKLVSACARLNVPIEINLLGVRGGRCYPTEKFWRIVGELSAPVTIGIDAHDPSAILDQEAEPVAKWLIKKHRLNYIGMAEIKNISNI